MTEKGALLQLIQAPGTMSSYATRICRSLARPYVALAEAFESGDTLRLEAEIEIAQSVWYMVSYVFGCLSYIPLVWHCI